MQSMRTALNNDASEFSVGVCLFWSARERDLALVKSFIVIIKQKKETVARHSNSFALDVMSLWVYGLY